MEDKDTVEFEQHLAEVLAWFSDGVEKKYRAGQVEHGGRLWRKPVLKHAKAEIFDLNVYLQVLDTQWHDVLRLLEEAINKMAVDSTPESTFDIVFAARNIMKYGNADGYTEEERNAGVEEEL